MDTVNNERDILHTASEIVEKNLIEYSQDVVNTKYPHPIDGLKPVQRRLLYLMGTTTQTIRLDSLLSDTGKLHPAGDSSIYSAAIRLAQSFSVGIPLLDIPGSVGDVYSPQSAAAPRYLDVASAELSRDLFFNGVYPKSIPMAPSKDFRLQEPIYFIPRLPTALYLNNLSIGYGFKSEVPCIPIEQICDIVMAFAEERSKPIPKMYPPLRKLAKYFIPDYPVYGYIRNKEELINQYTMGNFEHPIMLDGEIELGHNLFRIRNLPFGIVPEHELDSTIDNIRNNKNHWMHSVLKDIRNFKSDERRCEIQVELKNNTRVFRILNNLKKEFKVSRSIHPNYRYGMNGKLHHLNPYQLLDLWYRARMDSILSGLKGEQFDLAMDQQRALAYSVVADHTDKVIKIVRNNTEDTAVLELCKQFPKLTRMQARMLINARISTLTKNKKADLLLEIERISDKLESLQCQYGRIHETIYNDAQSMKKKYKVPRRSRFIEDAIGYVHLDKEGVIQFTDDDDLINILQNYRNYKYVDIQHYTKARPNMVAAHNGRLLDTGKGLPKEFSCSSVVLSPNGMVYNLIYIDGFVSVMDNVAKAMTQSNVRFQLVNRSFWAILRSGTVEATDISQYSTRKSVSKGAKSDLIYALPRQCKDYVVIHMNTKSPNEVRFDRILMSDDKLGRLSVLVRGTTKIISAVPIDSELVYVGLDADCLNMCATKILRITNIKNMFGDKNSVILELNKLRSSPVKQWVKKNAYLPTTMDINMPK